MDFYFIPPKKHLSLMEKGQRYFCLAQLYLNDENYRAYFNNLPKDAWVTLDNGAGDHDLVTEDQLFEAVKELMPNEVIPPDVLFNADMTVGNADRFYARMLREKLADKIEIFFCVQGASQDEWLWCYRWGLAQPWVKTLGLSKIGVPLAWLDATGDVGIMEARINAFNYLKVNNLLEKPLHLLGMGDPREFAYYKQFKEFKYIRSSDSCNAIWSAMNNLWWFDGDFKRIPTPKDYFDRDIENSTEMRNLINENMEFLFESVE